MKLIGWPYQKRLTPANTGYDPEILHKDPLKYVFYGQFYITPLPAYHPSS